MLKTRLITAALLLVLFGFVLWIGDKAFATASAVITGLIIYEFLAVSLIPSRRGEKFYQDDAVVYALLLTLPGLALVFLTAWMALALFTIAVTVFFCRECFLFESMPDEEPAKEVLSAFAIAVLYPFLFGLLFILSTDRIAEIFQAGAWRVILWFVFLVIASDTGAYFGGKLFGKNKLAPRISPNKTVEGAISGFVSVLIFSQIFAQFLKLPPLFLNQIVVAILIGLLAPIGDLVESFVKRLYGVKDMGRLLPGHGGVFDRVDSYIFASLSLFLLTI